MYECLSAGFFTRTSSNALRILITSSTLTLWISVTTRYHVSPTSVRWLGCDRECVEGGCLVSVCLSRVPSGVEDTSDIAQQAAHLWGYWGAGALSKARVNAWSYYFRHVYIYIFWSHSSFSLPPPPTPSCFSSASSSSSRCVDMSHNKLEDKEITRVFFRMRSLVRHVSTLHLLLPPSLLHLLLYSPGRFEPDG